MQVRRLKEDDAPALLVLRREALEREPASFGESLEEFLALPSSTYADRLRSGGDENFIYGAFQDSALIAMAGFVRERRAKRRQKGVIWGVYVTPAHRGKGVSRAVMTALLDSARALPGIGYIYLTVTSAQSPARQLYQSLGFRSFGTEPRALAAGGRYFDEEHMVLEI